MPVRAILTEWGPYLWWFALWGLGYIFGASVERRRLTFGFKRLKAAPAETEVTVTVESTDDVVIPAGQRFAVVKVKEIE